MHEVQNAAGRNDGGQQDSNDAFLFHGRSSPRMKVDFSSRLWCLTGAQYLGIWKCLSSQMKQRPAT
jgi:hypothetical protein